MQPTKKQIALAEMNFSYRVLRTPIPAKSAKESSVLLQQLWQQTLPEQAIDFYVLFVNKKLEVFCWYRLPRKEKADVFAIQIAGLALSCNAYGVIISQCCDVDTLKVNPVDWLFASVCFSSCEKAHIEIIDYVICSKTSYLSLKDSN